MNRLSAGAIAGLAGAILLILLSFVHVQFVGLLIPFAVGIGAGILVANNPKFASKTGGAGALAGLFAGAFLFVASLISAVIILNTNNDTITQATQQITATLTATASNGGSGNSSNIPVSTLVQGGIFFTFCIAGLLYLGIATGLGAAAGAIAGRNNQAVATPYMPYVPQEGYSAPPAGYPPQPGYPPPAQPGYGTQPPPPYTPPINDGTQ